MKKIISLICVLALALSCLFVLASCGATPNSDPEAAKASLEAEGYTVIKSGNTLTATKGTDGAMIQYCDSEDNAKAAYDAYQEIIKTAEEAGQDTSTVETGYSGKVFWYGTSAAIKAAQ